MVDFEKYRTVSMQEMLKTGGGAAGGLTVRDYFAAAAMQSLVKLMGRSLVDDETGLVDFEDDPIPDGECRTEYFSSDWCVMDAYAIADRMMKERAKPLQKPTPTAEEAFGLDK